MLQIFILILSLPALTGRTRLLERCSNSRVRPVVGRTLSDRSESQLVGQILPVRPPVEHGCLSTAQTAVFDRLMPAVSEFIFHMELRRPSSDLSTRTTTSLE
ncbi:hypothetical protein PCASD_25046 [Puccinia coronata f. sp. avenae]|uniref:Secreted protein n=1 Tax=Puccinia coronata f. sp. avenae TaxID=200324 RepID=A0A2N5S848_9BASI|nr:hypothetical protein PCASD_25046 [Puccinia coronata f. sp. avenae]